MPGQKVQRSTFGTNVYVAYSNENIMQRCNIRGFIKVVRSGGIRIMIIKPQRRMFYYGRIVVTVNINR
jgi:hypothetical protein